MTLRKICSSLVLLALALPSWAGTITGKLATATGGPQANVQIQFTLNAPNTLAGSFSVSTSPVSCWTSTDGSVVGLPNPLSGPTLSTNIAAGALPASTYFVKTTWFNSTGETLASPESSVVLSAPGTVIVTAPVTGVPAAATQWRVYISSATGTETLQGNVAVTNGVVGGNFSQSVALVVGTALPGSNTSACSITFNDRFLQQPNSYSVSVTTSTGAKIQGISRTGKTYLAGGANGVIDT